MFSIGDEPRESYHRHSTKSPVKEKDATVRWFLLVLVALVWPKHTIDAEEWKPPTHVDSPDRRFSVQIQNTAADEKSINDRLLIIRDRDKEIARQKTLGYLIDAFWDDTGKYVAVNNRRANAGDYVWIFSLPDGKCVKAPDSPQLAFLSKSALEAFHRLDSRATDEKLEKVWVKAKGFWGSGNKLLIRFAARYGYTAGKFPAHFVYDAQVKISGSNLVLLSGEARRVDYLSD
jgi:hypothetical protein